MYPNTFQSLSLRSGAAVLAALQVFAGLPVPASAQDSGRDNVGPTRSPIKHVIVIIGENRTFDHVFATYKPRDGQTVDNLLSKHIVNANGTPGPRFALAHQYAAVDTTNFEESPGGKTLYPVLPPPLVGGPTTPYISSLAVAKAVENGLPNDQYYTYLTTVGHGTYCKDSRYPHPQREQLAPWTFPDHAGHSLRRVCGEPCASCLPDVATVGLQRELCDAAESQRMQGRSVPVG